MMEPRCKFWLPKKRRFCANVPLADSPFCGNHTERSDARWIPCPLDPSHSVLAENLEGHLKRCPLLKFSQSLSQQPYFRKGINGGKYEGILSNGGHSDITSEMKRTSVYSLTIDKFQDLIFKIKSIHETIVKQFEESYKIPDACDIWIKRQIDRKLPFQEKHVMQQAAILGNMEEFGLLKRLDNLDLSTDDTEKGDENLVCNGNCYGIERVILVERKSYKLKADRSLRQKESLLLERLRIDIEDLDLNAVESLRGLNFLAIGKHLCGPATDMTIRCCLGEANSTGTSPGCCMKGIAIATCCHHLCQWKHYINKEYFISLGLVEEEFNAITWFTSWAVDDNHGPDLSLAQISPIQINEEGQEQGVKGAIGNMETIERAALGFMCKQIIDVGRLMWLRDSGLGARIVRYVPRSISPENSLLIARRMIR
ncbi:hypothetical protein MLD38_021278 [Melastoma candidum]|uniref:Uncharacterized protein n=1 Tax=Melastoma candidum TaxID=119954 RepID=A0ACB9QFS3_9MYRT|nr:hypothetical protein MLD38_021278 [Melastoma candidum]